MHDKYGSQSQYNLALMMHGQVHKDMYVILHSYLTRLLLKI